MIGIALNSQWKRVSNKPKTHLQFVLCRRIRLLLLPFGYTNFPWPSRLRMTTLFPCYLEDLSNDKRSERSICDCGMRQWKERKKKEVKVSGLESHKFKILFSLKFATAKMRQELILEIKKKGSIAWFYNILILAG